MKLKNVHPFLRGEGSWPSNSLIVHNMGSMSACRQDAQARQAAQLLCGSSFGTTIEDSSVCKTILVEPHQTQGSRSGLLRGK